MEGGDLVHAKPLMTVDKPTRMGIVPKPARHTAAKPQIRQPARTLGYLTQLDYLDARRFLDMATLAHHFDPMAERGQFAGQLPNITLHTADWTVAAHDMQQLHFSVCHERGLEPV
ncbi:hypothetical protein FGKAn22_23180 [Ferrigenium kumadai]|uniref:Uncharacterized protein n=1 Tax=Ferrigenium kumadai TaxID=1682490 RepID=A0AAN1W0Q7_9PROT|nr:hypothetical protein FGKAn22_23180 [Ferrigenium kumadai]